MAAQFDRLRKHPQTLAAGSECASEPIKTPELQPRITRINTDKSEELEFLFEDFCWHLIRVIRVIRGSLLDDMREHLPALTAKIAAALAIRPEVFITHPAELRILSSMPENELRRFAAEHGWRHVRRIGGRQIEFYNDASARIRDL